MPYIRFNPYWEFQNLAKEMNKFMNYTPAPPKHEAKRFVPAVDIFEDADYIYFELEVPGINKDEIKLSVNDDKILTIRGHKKVKLAEDVQTCCRSERRSGEFSRSFQIPEYANIEKIDAKQDMGILYIKIGKMNPSDRKESEVTIH